MRQLPARLYICPACGYQTEYRWRLRDHLQRVHSLKRNDAADVATSNEYLANPRYYRVSDIDDYEDFDI